MKNCSHKGYIRIRIALQKLNSAAFGALINGNSVATNGGKNERLPFLQVVVELCAEQGLAVIFFYTATELTNNDSALSCVLPAYLYL